MPYLQVELDALDDMDRAAKMAAVDPGEVYRGLLRLWKDCWRRHDVVLERSVLAGYFAGDLERVVAALTCCGFVAVLENGMIRVRGAKRLGISKSLEEGRRKGGLAAKKHLKQYQNPPGPTAGPSAGVQPDRLPPAEAGDPAGAQPVRPPAEAPASTGSLHPASNIQHPASKRGFERASAPPERPPVACELEPDVAVGALRDGIDAEFERQRGVPYRWGHEDERALGPLMAFGQREILRRWGIALRRVRFPACGNVVELAKHWNHYAADEPSKNAVRETSDEEIRRALQAHPKDEKGDLLL